MTCSCCITDNSVILHTLFSGEFELTPEEEALKPQYQAEWDKLKNPVSEATISTTVSKPRKKRA